MLKTSRNSTKRDYRPIHERLIDIGIKIKEKRIALNEEKQSEELVGCTFKPETNLKKDIIVQKEKQHETHFEFNDFNAMMGGTHTELVQ